MRLGSFLLALLCAAAALARPAAETYVVTLEPAAAVDGTETMAARLAATYGGTVIEMSGDAFVLQIPAARARLVARDPNVASVVAAIGDVSADAVTETVNWSAGVLYEYDGSGNIKEIGSDRFAYDSVGRLVNANVNGIARSYTYDAPGNRTGCSQPQGDCQLGMSIESANNRIRNATYDGSGNLQRLPAATRTHSYDALNMETRDVAGSAREFIYTADDQRLAVYSEAGSSWTWTLRDVDGNVLRELTSNGSNWQWNKDYVWRSGLLLATLQPNPGSTPSRFHYHLDHLGSPRRITDARDRIVGVHDYHAFGTELAGGTDETPRTDMKYTGHERDEGGLDYMLARYYDSALGRFLSTDRASESVEMPLPQSWNRYSYVRNRPMIATDPSGEILRFEGRYTKQYYDDYMKGLDPSSQDYKNAKQLENSNITYTLKVGGMEGKKEGEVTFNGSSVILSLDSGGPMQDASMNSRLAHEIQHGVQVDEGRLGFIKNSNTGKWQAIYGDVHDEVEAWTAQARQATEKDWHSGNLRGFVNADDKADFLSRHGYPGYQGKLNIKSSVPPAGPGQTPGTLIHTASIFYRLPF